MTDDPSPPAETPDSSPDDLDGLSTELFGEPPAPGEPLAEPEAPTLFDLADSARHRRRRWSLGAFIAVFSIVVVGAILLLATREGSEGRITNATTASLQLFACPGEADPVVVLGEGDLVLDGVDASGEWVRLAQPVAGIAEGWGRVDEIEGPIPALPVRECETSAEDAPSNVAAETETPTTVRTPTAEPTPEPTPRPTATPVEAASTPAPSARPPAEVRVQVANGGTTAGAAGRATARLDDGGYVTQPARNASNRGRTEIYFAAGYEDDAVAVAQLLTLDDPRLVPLTARNQPGFDPGRAQIVVILGPPDA